MELKPCTDMNSFNNFVCSSAYGHIHQTFEWGEIKSHFGWKPLRYTAEENGQIVATISVLKTYKQGIPILYASRGPVLDYENYNAVNFLLPKLQDIARQEKALFLRISPAVRKSNEGIRNLLEKNKYIPARNPQQHTVTMLLNLENTDPETLLKSFHEKTRYNIRLAFKKGVTVAPCTDEKDIDVFYKLLQQMSKRQDYELFPLEFYKTVFRVLVPKNMATLYLAYFGGKIVGGIFNLHCANKTWYMWGASDHDHRQYMPNYALHWTAIQDAFSKGIKTYDFQGIPEDTDPKNPMWGFYNFKKGFNGETVRWVGEWDIPGRLKTLYMVANKLRLV
jgi:peptidoglycan pentaglycine glycine transferase (the first glycine)